MRRRAGIEFQAAGFKAPQSQGGARNGVEARSQIAQDEPASMNATRIYQSQSVRNFDTSDPRYVGKSDQVENIYLAAPEVANKPRSGIAQIFNWIVNGRLA